MSISFSKSLKLLSFNHSNDEKGLFFLKDVGDFLTPEIRFILEDAKPYKPTAIYITRLNNQTPKPQIYIYDNTNNNLSNNEIRKLHKELWNSAKIPLFFIFSQTEVKIFNCRKSPESLNDLSVLETINLASKTQKEIKKRKYFDAKMFDSGLFWEQDRFKNEFKFENSVYNILLNDLENLREYLLKKDILSKDATESLLIKSILIKYLDERGVFNQQENFWSQFNNKSKFSEIFEDSKLVLEVFDTLAKHFNGGVFDLSKYKNEIKNASLALFRDFLEADIEITTDSNKQKLLWSKYSFKDLPIELISNIYELFLKSDEIEKNGIVYTPPILVDFMIDEIMPLDKPKDNFKLLDPSCGSGIFLVGAYKRLIQWWRIQHNYEKPSIKEAQKIINNSIFGVDKEKGAIEVAYFSLSLALCDTFLPEQIWEELRFDDLRTNNLLKKDFFEFIKESKKRFDLVIGNPPFVSKKQKLTKSALETYQKESVPDAQLSFLFLEQSLKLLKQNSFLVMIQPSAFLYNHGAFEFRNKIFEKYKCYQVIDFACLNTSLFKKSKRGNKGADVAVSVSFLQNIKPNIKEDALLHITVRQTTLAREKIYFDLSHYDFHWLRYKDVLNQKSIWKCDLMGGSRIRDIVERLGRYRKLGDFLKEKEKSNNWIYSEGFTVWEKGKYLANYITGHKVLPAYAFNENGINESAIYICQLTSFERPRKKELYEPPHLLIKEKLGNKKLIVAFRDDYLTFKNDTIGIHAPKNEKQELLLLENQLKKYSSLYLFYLSSTSGSAGVGRATSIVKKDIDLLPYPDNENDLKLSKIEQYFVDDTLDYMMDFCKGKKDTPLLKNSNDKQIEEYCTAYKEVLEGIYDNIKILDNYHTDLYQIVAFYFGDKPNKSIFDEKNSVTDEVLSNLVSNYNQTLSISRIVRLYNKNIIYIIKPRHYRFWLKSVAVRDADETFADLLNMGY